MTVSIAALTPAVTGTAGTLSTASATPSAGSILLVAEWAFLNAIGTVTIADTFGDTGGTAWVAFTGSVHTTTGTFQNTLGGWWRRIGTGPTAGTITTSYTGFTGSNNILIVDQVSKTTETLSVAQSIEIDASFGTTGTVTLSTGPAASSAVWSIAQLGGTTTTPAVTTAGYSAAEIKKAAANIQEATSFKIASAAAAVAWSGLDGGHANDLLAVEVTITAGGVTFIAPRPFTKSQAVMAGTYFHHKKRLWLFE